MKSGDWNSTRLDSLNEVPWLGSFFVVVKESLGSKLQILCFLKTTVISSCSVPLNPPCALALARKVNEVSEGVHPFSLISWGVFQFSGVNVSAQLQGNQVWRERLEQLLQVPATLEACIEELHRG